VRTRPSFMAYLALGVLTATAVARYGGDVEWGSLPGWVLVAAIALAVGLGGYGTVISRPSHTPPDLKKR
jgi:hypothetical protein